MVAQLLAATALLIGATNVPSPDQAYVDNQTQRYIVPYFGAIPETNRHGVTTPAQFWPISGSLTFDQSVAGGVTDLDNTLATQSGTVVILGYSQSTRIATIEKQHLVAEHEQNGTQYPDYSFVLVANVNKPNGGILERFNGWSIPILGVTFDGATRTDSTMPTADITFLYDGFSDFPTYPLNLLADANAVAGMFYLHSTYATQTATPVMIGTKGDTTYYAIEPDIVPILMPLQQLGVPRPVLLALNEPIKVLIETGYRRDISPGSPTPAYLLPIINPLTLIADFAEAISVGIDDGLQASNLGRPLGTTAPGIYGVGGNDTAVQDLPPGFIPLSNPTPSTQSPSTPASPLRTTTDRVVRPDTSHRTALARNIPKLLQPKAHGPVTSDVSPKLSKSPALRKIEDQPLKRVLKVPTGQRPQKIKTSSDDTSPALRKIEDQPLKRVLKVPTRQRPQKIKTSSDDTSPQKPAHDDTGTA